MLISPRQHILESITLDGQNAQADREFRCVQMIGGVANLAH